ncbi:Yos1-like protein [Blastocladiella britannica]|nr:Yos1-like protein [Blastocladiella britannica]
MFGLGGIFYFVLLLVNAVAILNEERFLARIGWSAQSVYGDFGQQSGMDSGVKANVVTLLSAVRTLMRIPLIVVNSLAIVYLLLLG